MEVLQTHQLSIILLLRKEALTLLSQHLIINDIELVKKVIMDVALAHPKVLKDPAPFVRLDTHNASSLDFTCRLWVKGADYWDVHFDMLEQVKVACDKNDIEIPYPQIVVHNG
jgi:small conductance mechanosensitive channel